MDPISVFARTAAAFASGPGAAPTSAPIAQTAAPPAAEQGPISLPNDSKVPGSKPGRNRGSVQESFLSGIRGGAASSALPGRSFISSTPSGKTLLGQ